MVFLIICFSCFVVTTFSAFQSQQYFAMGRRDTANVASDESQKSSAEESADGDAYVVERIVDRKVTKGGKVSKRFVIWRTFLLAVHQMNLFQNYLICCIRLCITSNGKAIRNQKTHGSLLEISTATNCWKNSKRIIRRRINLAEQRKTRTKRTIEVSAKNGTRLLLAKTPMSR